MGRSRTSEVVVLVLALSLSVFVVGLEGRNLNEKQTTTDKVYQPQTVYGGVITPGIGTSSSVGFSFPGTNYPGFLPRGSSFRGSSFPGSLPRTGFPGSTLPGTSFPRSILPGTSFPGSLPGSSFRRSGLPGGFRFPGGGVGGFGDNKSGQNQP